MFPRNLFTHLDQSTNASAPHFRADCHESFLVSRTEELSALRFYIILTSRWMAEENEGPDYRAEMAKEISLLCRSYGKLIDEIALTCGVKQAMKTQEEVERTIRVPYERETDSGHPYSVIRDERDYGI